MQVQVKASSSRYSQVNYHQRCTGGTENMQGQIQTCSNLQGQVEEAPWDNPSMKSPVWAGLGMDWLQGLTFRQRHCAAELLQRRFHFIHLSLLNKGLKSGELLEDGAWFVPPGDAAQEVLHRPREETTLLGRRRGWRRRGSSQCL